MNAPHSDYATAEETASVMRQATPDELWLEAQLERIAPDRNEMGSAGTDDALVKLVFELRDLVKVQLQAHTSPDPEVAYQSRCYLEDKQYDKASFLAGYDQGSYDEAMQQGPNFDPEPSSTTSLCIYIAGPMTGLPELNFPAFHAEAARLRALGWRVVNPAEINPNQSMTWNACMRRDIAELVTCDAIRLLPGWHESKGATLEHHIAERLGMRVYVGEEMEA